MIAVSRLPYSSRWLPTALGWPLSAVSVTRRLAAEGIGFLLDFRTAAGCGWIHAPQHSAAAAGSLWERVERLANGVPHGAAGRAGVHAGPHLGWGDEGDDAVI